MKKLKEKKLKFFGREISILLVAVLTFVGFGSAALLSYFGIITGTVVVSSGLLVDGQNWDAATILDSYEDFTSLEEKTFLDFHRLDNIADIDVELNLVKEYISGDWTDLEGTNYYQTSERGSMVFEGQLNEDDEGILAATKGSYYVDNGRGESVSTAGGFDVYAENGAIATFTDVPTEQERLTISDHDAWPTGVADTPDWYAYSLELTSDSWALRNHPGNNDADDPWYDNSDGDTQEARGVPMSGSMDWTNMYALETGTGEYITGTGTAEVDDNLGGAQAWDMDWSWGSEYVPLEYPGFKVIVQYDIDEEGTDRVILIPSEETAIKSINVEDAESEDFAIVTHFPKMTMSDTYEVTTTVNLA